MKYEKFESGPAGKWVDKAKLVDVKKAKIVSEVQPYPSRFKNEKTGETQMQDVGSIQFEGLPEPFNMSINLATRNALIEAFGQDSKNWMNQVLSVAVLESPKGYSVYLIPAGFKRVRDEKNFVVIVREDDGKQPAPDDGIPTIELPNDEKEIKIEDVPF